MVKLRNRVLAHLKLWKIVMFLLSIVIVVRIPVEVIQKGNM